MPVGSRLSLSLLIQSTDLTAILRYLHFIHLLFFCLFVWFHNVLVNYKVISRTGPKAERVTILRAATYETDLGDHDFCLNRSHYTDTDPTSRYHSVYRTRKHRNEKAIARTCSQLAFLFILTLRTLQEFKSTNSLFLSAVMVSSLPTDHMWSIKPGLFLLPPNQTIPDKALLIF